MGGLSWRFLRTASAVWLGSLAGIYLGGWLQAQPSPNQIDSSLGTYPLPPVVGMTQSCPGYLLATGELHDQNDTRYWVIGSATLMLHPDGIPALQVRQLLGQKVDLVIRKVERQHEQLER